MKMRVLDQWPWPLGILWGVCLLPAVSELPFMLLMLSMVFWAISLLVVRLPLKNLWRMSMLVAAMAVVWQFKSGPLRVNDALHFLLFLPILKNMELATERDRRIQILILVLLWSASLLLSDQLYWILASVMMVWVFGSLLYLSANDLFSWRMSDLFPAFQAVLKTLVPAIPLALIFFILFPRMQFFGRIHWPAGTSGISDQLRPGSVAALALDDSVYARVLLEDRPFEASERGQYWRYVTLRQSSDGLNWFRQGGRSLAMALDTPPTSSSRLFQVYYQQIGEGMLIHPEGTLKLSPLNRMTITAHRDQTFSAIYFQGKNPFYRGLWDEIPVADPPHRNDMARPTNVSPRMIELAKKFSANPRPLEALGEYFKDNFRYSLTPGVYASLDEFAFDRREGYCEHFSALAATLIRLWGMPARVVVGFLVQPSAQDLSFNILNSDAHAWVEYWSAKDQRWLRFDPIVFVAPERILLSQQRWRAYQSSADKNIARFLTRPAWAGSLAWLQGIYLQSNVWLLNYDREQQRQLWRFEGKSSLWLWTVLLALLSGAGIVFAISEYRRQRNNRLPLAYRRLILKHFPAAREHLRTPQFWQECARAQWHNASDFEQLVKSYCHLRYGTGRTLEKEREWIDSARQFHPNIR